jgi:hypothetical protein
MVLRKEEGEKEGKEKGREGEKAIPKSCLGKDGLLWTKTIAWWSWG